MDETLTPRQLRRGALLAALAAPTLTAAGLASAMLALASPCASQEDTICAVMAAILTCALIRLALASTRAAFDLRREAATMAAAVVARSRAHDDAGRRGGRHAAEARPVAVAARTRTAGAFLALAALTTLGAQAASADDGVPRPTFSATATVGDATGPGAGARPAAPATDVPHPSFTASTDSDIVILPMRAAPDAAATSEQGPTPLPRWTPDPLATTTSVSPLVLGSPRSGAGAGPSTTHVVMKGDTLWSVAASHLAPHAPAEQVAAAVTTWIDANPLLRFDPDLLEIGTELTVPAPAVTFGAQR